MRHTPLFRRILRSLRRFGRNESGMTLPLLALSMVALTGTTGITIDVARLQLVQSKLQSSLDAAGLAGGSTVNTANLNTEVTKYMDANFNGYMGASLVNATATTNASNSVINLSATATLPTTFLSILGIQTMTANASSQPRGSRRRRRASTTWLG